jgi:hypothetical protein
MPGIEDIDTLTDLNTQDPDAQPYHADAVPEHRSTDTPSVIPGDKEPTEPPASLRDTLTDAFKGSEAPKVDDPPQAAETPSPPLPEGTPELVKVGERYHRKDGSFAAKEEIDAFNAATAGTEGQQAPVQQAPWMQGLTELEKTQYAALPAEMQQYVARTMESVDQRSAQLQEYQQLEQMIIGPRREAWAANGANPASALNQLLALSDFAGTDPGQFVMWFADQHKLDLDALLDARDEANASNGGAPDPHIAGLQQQIQQLQNTIGGFQNLTLQQQQAQNMRTVQTFIEEKDAGGQPAHPYFNEVADDIARHVAIIRQQQPYLAEHDILKAA